MTDSFYDSISAFSNFNEFHLQTWYHPLPVNWVVVITDVVGSTKAIEQGKYKQVNAMGVASIVAITNALKPLKIPFIFGGDGATACFPKALLPKVEPALIAAEKMAQEQFALQLRVGVVSMLQIKEQGLSLCVAKYQPHKYYQQAMFAGEGLAYAESLIKNQQDDNPYLIKMAKCASNAIFSGFECRWNEIPSPQEENITLMVQVIDPANTDNIYAAILAQVQHIYGKDPEHHPLTETNLTLTKHFNLLSIEAKIRTAFQSKWQNFLYLIKLKILKRIGERFMANKKQTKNTHWGEYKQNLIMNTDYRKFDGILRMVISGQREQRKQLNDILNAYRLQGDIVFGLHHSECALITCIVTDYNKDHIHFLDGANGGYTIAAKQMKQQLREL